MGPGGDNRQPGPARPRRGLAQERTEKPGRTHTSIDTAAHWTKSGWHGCVYGWKLRLATAAAAVWIPLAAELTPANRADNEEAPALLRRL